MNDNVSVEQPNTQAPKKTNRLAFASLILGLGFGVIYLCSYFFCVAVVLLFVLFVLFYVWAYIMFSPGYVWW